MDDTLPCPFTVGAKAIDQARSHSAPAYALDAHGAVLASGYRWLRYQPGVV